MLSRVIAHFRTNKQLEELSKEVKEFQQQVEGILKQIEVINKNIVILDNQNKQLNGVSEIMCAVQQQMLDDLSYTATSEKKSYIFPLRKPEDDDLPN